MYDSVDTCPEELLLFFHHLPYNYVLKSSGKTIIDHIYATHFEGVDEAKAMLAAWQGLHGDMDAAIQSGVAARMEQQIRDASEWRDAINGYFSTLSNIPIPPQP